MRHQVKGRKLGRSTPHRKATLQALSVALIKEKRIKTTLPKAKELRRFVEPIITKAKNDTTHNRRQAFASLRDKNAVTELFDHIADEVGDRPGGYTRVLKLGTRLGDAAEMAVIELVDFNDVKPEKKEATKKRTRRAGRSNKPTDANESAEKETSAKKDKSKEGAPKAAAPEAIEATAEEAEASAVEEQVEKKDENAEVKTASSAEETAAVEEEDTSDSDVKAEAETDAENDSETEGEEPDEKK